MAVLLRYGMVGGGPGSFIGKVHRDAIAVDPRVRLVAGAFSTKPENNLSVGELYSLDSDRIYASYQEMAEKEAAREDGIDFVCITTPNNTHYEIAKYFLEKGIHVVCEKPLCFTVQEAEELARLTREKGLIFGVTYTYPGYAMCKVMKEMITDGKIGKIVSVNAEYVQDWLLGELCDGNLHSNIAVWRTDPSQSGIANCVGDIGTHIEHTVHYLTGLKIKRLAATINRFGKPLELNANMLIEYEGGINGAYWCSQIAAGKLNGFIIRIYGTEGALEWEQHYPDYVHYTPKGCPTQIISRGCSYIGGAAAGVSRLPAGHPEGLTVAFANIYKNITDAILKVKTGGTVAPGEFDFADVEDGLAGVKFVHAVIESGDNDSRWVTL